MRRHFVIFLVLIQSVFAQDNFDCAEVNLGENGPFAKMEITNQKESNLCYAYSVTQLVDAFRIDKGDEQLNYTSDARLAGVMYAIQEETHRPGRRYFEQEEGETIAGQGNSYRLYDYLRSEGVCDKAHADLTLVPLNILAAKFLNDPFTELLGSYRLRQSRGEIPVNEEAQAKNNVLRQILTSSYLSDEDTQNLPAGKAASRLAYIKNMLIGQTMYMDLCRKHEVKDLPTKLAGVSLSETVLRGEQNFYHNYQQSLRAKFSENNPQALGLTYCMDLLIDKDYKKINRSGQAADPCSTGRHVSVLIGSRKIQRANRNVCQYLLRNSFGEDCSDSRLDPRWRPDCSRGQIWVDEESLLLNANEFFWIDKNS